MSRFNSGRFQPQYLWNRFVFYLFHVIARNRVGTCVSLRGGWSVLCLPDWDGSWKGIQKLANKDKGVEDESKWFRSWVIMGRYYFLDHKVFYTLNYETVQRRRGYGIEIALTCHKDFSHSRIAMYIMVRWTTTAVYHGEGTKTSNT